MSKMPQSRTENGDNSTEHLLKQGMLLTVAIFLVRIIGVFYRIPLTNLWGDAALGTYSDAYTIYSLFLMISSVSVPTMMSKLISEKAALGKNNDVKKIMRCCLILFSGLGLIGCVIMLVAAPFFANVVFNNPDLVLPIRGLAPTVLVVSVVSCYRGYFTGLNNMKPSAFSQIIESLIHALFSIIFAFALLKISLSMSVFGGILATGLAAVFSLIFLLWCYRTHNKKNPLGRAKASLAEESDKDVYRAIILMILPILLSNVIYNIKSIIDSSIFANMMKWKGYDVETIKAMKGLYSGKFTVFLAIPIAIGDSVAAAVVPSISADYSLKDFASVRRKANDVTKTVLLITVPAGIGLMLLGKPIVHAFFPSAPLGGELFWIGSFAAAFYSVSDISTGILQGAGFQNKPMWNSLWATCISIVVTLILITAGVGIYTLPISMLVFSLARMLLNVFALRKDCRIRIRLAKMFVRPLIGAMMMAVIGAVVYVLAFSVFGSNLLALLFAVAAAVICYFVIMVNMGWLTEKDMQTIPYGKYLAYLKF